MTIKTYKINEKKEWIFKKEFKLEQFKSIADLGGSSGVDLFFKNGKKLNLATIEMFDLIMSEWNQHKDSTTFSYIYDEKGQKCRDTNGKLLRKYTKDEYKNLNQKAYNLLYIKYEDFNKILNKFEEDYYK